MTEAYRVSSTPARVTLVVLLLSLALLPAEIEAARSGDKNKSKGTKWRGGPVLRSILELDAGGSDESLGGRISAASHSRSLVGGDRQRHKVNCYAFNTSSECRTGDPFGACIWCNGAEKTGPYCCPTADATRCNAYCEATKCSSYQHYDSCVNSWQYAGGSSFHCYWCNSKLLATKGPYCTSELEYNPACPSCSDFTTVESCRDLLTDGRTTVCAWCSGNETTGRYCATTTTTGGIGTPSHYNPQCPSCQSYRTKTDCLSPYARNSYNHNCYWCSGAHDTGNYCTGSITYGVNPNCPPCASYRVDAHSDSSAAACASSSDSRLSQCAVCRRMQKVVDVAASGVTLDGLSSASPRLVYACVALGNFRAILSAPNKECAASCRDLQTSHLCENNYDAHGNLCVWCGPLSTRAQCFPTHCSLQRWSQLHITRDSCMENPTDYFAWCTATEETGDYCIPTQTASQFFYPQCGSCMQYTTHETCGRSYNALGQPCSWCVPTETHVNGSYCIGSRSDDPNPSCSCANFNTRASCTAVRSYFFGCQWCNWDTESGPYCSDANRISAITQTDLLNPNCPSCDTHEHHEACVSSSDFRGLNCFWCEKKRRCTTYYGSSAACAHQTPADEIHERAVCVADGRAWCNATANNGQYCTSSSYPNRNCAPCTSHETIASCLASIDTDSWQCGWCNAALHSGPYCMSHRNPNLACTIHATLEDCLSDSYCAWCAATATKGRYCFSSSASPSSNPNCPTCEAQRSDATCFALERSSACQWFNPNETTGGEYCYDAREGNNAPSDFPTCDHFTQPMRCGAAFAPGTSEHCVWCNASTSDASEQCVAPSQVASLCQPCLQYATWESCLASADSAGEKDGACQWCNPIVKVGPYCTSKRAPNTQHCGCTVYNERSVCRSAQDPIGQPCSWCVANATSGSFCTSISPGYPRNPTCPACHNATTPAECAGNIQNNGLQCRWCNTIATEGRYCVDTTRVVDRVGLGCTSCPLITTSSTMCGLVGCEWCSRFATTNAQYCTSPDQPNPNCKACDAYATKVECNSHLDPSSETNCTWCGSQVCSSGSCGHCFSLTVPDFVIQPYALSVIGVVKDFLLLVFFSLFWQLTYWRFVAQRRVRACVSSSSSSDDASQSHMYALVFLHDDECIVVDRHEKDDSRRSKPVVSHHDTIVAAVTQQHQRAVSKELVWFAIHALRAWEKAVDVSALEKNRSRSDSEMHESHHTLINSSEPFASGSSKEARQEKSQHLLESSEDSSARAHHLKALTKPKHVTAALRKLPLIPAFYVASRRPLARMIASWHNFPGSALMSLYCAAAILMLTLTTYHVLRVRVARQLSALNCVLLIGYRMVNSGASQTLLLVWFQGCKRSNRVRLRVTQIIPRLLMLHTLLFSPFLVLGVAPGFVLYAQIFIPVLTLTFVVYCCGAFLAWRLCFGRWTRQDSSSILSAVDTKRTSQRDDDTNLSSDRNQCATGTGKVDEGDDDDATLANDEESVRVFALDDDSENERSEHTSESSSLSTATAEQSQDITNQRSGSRFSRLRNFTRDVETRLAEVHNATPSLPPLRRVAVVLLAFLTERALPVLVLSIVMQMAYNYAVLHVYTGVFGYWDVVIGEYNARSAACFIAQVERKTRLTLAELSRGAQTWSSFLPFL